MTRYKIILEYDGTDLIGWQANKDGPSVQSLVSSAIFKFSGESVDLVSAGRTDAGVHAIAMPAHFDLAKEADADTVMRALNFYLGNSPVAVLNASMVSDDFHARFSCVCRRYRYVILNRNTPPVLERNRVWWIPRPLDMEKMLNAADKLIGHHDFTSFRAAECQAKSPMKTMDDIIVTATRDKIYFDFIARSFLHHQIRNMMGTLVDIGLGKNLDIEKIFKACNRAAAGPTAPSDGLYFVSAEY